MTNEATHENLVQRLQRQIDRVQAILNEYERIPEGQLAAAMMRAAIALAKQRIGTGDTLGMLASYGDLESYSL